MESSISRWRVQSMAVVHSMASSRSSGKAETFESDAVSDQFCKQHVWMIWKLDGKRRSNHGIERARNELTELKRVESKTESIGSFAAR